MPEQVASHVDRAFAVIGARDAVKMDGTFVQFYEVAFPRVYAFIRSHVASMQVAQDIAGRVFLKAYQHRAKLPVGEEGMLWAFRVARTTLIDHWRVENRRESVSISLEELADVPTALADPEALYLTKERSARLLRVIGELDEEERLVLTLKFTAQCMNREIGAILGLAPGAVSMRLLRALRRLRARLLELGIS